MTNQRHLIRAAATAVLLYTASAPLLAADPAAAPSYARDRADCNAGKTAEDRATCMKEAGAAAEEQKRGRLDNAGSAQQNATDRCNALPTAEKTDCLARIKGPASTGQRVTTSGSVAGGGIVRETTTVIPGATASAPMGSASRAK